MTILPSFLKRNYHYAITQFKGQKCPSTSKKGQCLKAWHENEWKARYHIHGPKTLKTQPAQEINCKIISSGFVSKVLVPNLVSPQIRHHGQFNSLFSKLMNQQPLFNLSARQQKKNQYQERRSSQDGLSYLRIHFTTYTTRALMARYTQKRLYHSTW